MLTDSASGLLQAARSNDHHFQNGRMLAR